MILRDRDMSNGWTGAGDGTLEERVYYCQNYHADVIAVLNSSGGLFEQARYGEYGDVFGIPLGDIDGDGDVNNGNTDDSDQIQTWINAIRTADATRIENRNMMIWICRMRRIQLTEDKLQDA